VKNPASKTIEISSINNYFNRALKTINAENKDIKESGYKSAQ
tara:strand:- start:1098 stop:1223 length:126 start_codon:yes stop_codon:yes gene_type:complete